MEALRGGATEGYPKTRENQEKENEGSSPDLVDTYSDPIERK